MNTNNVKKILGVFILKLENKQGLRIVQSGRRARRHISHRGTEVTERKKKTKMPSTKARRIISHPLSFESLRIARVTESRAKGPAFLGETHCPCSRLPPQEPDEASVLIASAHPEIVLSGSCQRTVCKWRNAGCAEDSLAQALDKEISA